MPRLNQDTGKYLCGVGGGGGRLFILIGENNKGETVDIGDPVRHAICQKIGVSPDFGEGSGAVWHGKNSISVQLSGLSQLGPTMAGPFIYDLGTGQVWGPYCDAVTEGFGRGDCVAWWNSKGAYTSYGYHRPSAAVSDVLGNGWAIVTKLEGGAPKGMLVVPGDNVEHEVPMTNLLQKNVVARDTRILWQEEDTKLLKAFDTTTWQYIPAPVAWGVYNNTGPFAKDGQGRTWIIDIMNGLMVRRWDVLQGYGMSFDSHDFNPDMVALPDGRLRVITSFASGEEQGQRVYEIDTVNHTCIRNGLPFAIQLIDLTTGQPVEPVEPPVTPPDPVDPPIIIIPPGAVELVEAKVSPPKVMFFANGDMKLTVRVPKGGLTTPNLGDTIKIVKQ